jgi:hypothetical protein
VGIIDPSRSVCQTGNTKGYRLQLVIDKGDIFSLFRIRGVIRSGFQKEEKRYRKEIWDYIQYRESLARWPLMKEKIKMGLNHNNG